MKRCGGIPEPTMDAYVNTIDERNKHAKELAIAREESKESDEIIQRQAK